MTATKNTPVYDMRPVTPPERAPRGRKKTPAKDSIWFELFTKIKTDHPKGQWVRVVEYANPSSAYQTRRLIVDGNRPIPGTINQWEIEAHRESIVRDDGERVQVSALYARWIGPQKKMKKGEGK